jgi:pSer/pThr/pTyr-binding forkhead associated (FHA) protein
VASDLLRVVSGSAAGTEVSLDGEFIVGRGETGPGRLGDDTEISRRHARFGRDAEGHLTVEDLGSTNGTYINGRRVTAPTVLVGGDEIKVGRTVLRFEDGGRTEVRRSVAEPQATVVGGATVQPSRPARPPEQPKAPAPPAAPPPAGPEPALPAAGGPISGPPRTRTPRHWRRGWIDVAALLAAAAVVIAITLIDTTGERATAATNCGENIGDAGQVAFVTYVQSNIAEGDNGVLITPYGADMKPQETTQCLTGGSGATQLTMPGVIDGNDQVVVNEDQTLLFAVNQGSDSVAAFRIEDNGGLEPVDGSPFDSGGIAPSSLGISGDTLVVANKARDGVRDLEKETPNYTSFKISADGRLTPVADSSVESKPASAPTSAVVPDRGGVVFGLEDGGPIRGMSIDGSGKLSEAEGSPITASPTAFAEGTPPPKMFALGVRAHPTEDLVYITYPLAPALAVYRYDDSGGLTFVNSVPTAGAFLPCWIQITGDGRFLYTTSAFTNNVLAYDLSDPEKPKQIQDLPFAEPGNAWNIALSPDDRFLFAITPRAVGAVPEGMGNIGHVMEIGPDGTLTELNPGSPTKFPVPDDAAPYGLGVAVPRG